MICFVCEQPQVFGPRQAFATTTCVLILANYRTMGRTCAQCGSWCNSSSFSSNQWRKGPGLSRCVDCVYNYQAPSPTFTCQTCYKSFHNQNELNMHMQVHRPRTIPCPVCGRAFFKSGANAVAHVESGYCSGCPGKSQARQKIFEFASSKPQMRAHMTPMLENGGQTSIPDRPYQCNLCARSFRDLSGLLQHQDQKHNNTRLLSNGQW